MAKSKTTKGIKGKSAIVQPLVPPIAFIPPIEPMASASTPQTPLEGTKDRESPFDIIPTPMSDFEEPQADQYPRTYSNPPTRPVTPSAPRVQEIAEEPIHEESQRAPPGPSPTRTRSNFGSRGPRSARATGEEPKMGDYFTKRRELLDILKSLHSTG